MFKTGVLSGIRQRLLLSTMVSIVFLTLWSAPASGQVDTGTILGTVRDTTGAYIVKAEVTLTNKGTSRSVSTYTGVDGSYIFTPLQIGTYVVQVESSGFGKVIREGVTLDIQQKAVVDFTLAAGRVTESIVVTAEAPLLQTQDGSVGQVIRQQVVNDMPLESRDWTKLALLTPGVTEPQTGARADNQFAANGTRPAQNDFLLDGIDNNSNSVSFLSGKADVVKPPVDAIEEFKIQTNNFSAEFGRAGGAIVNATLKSGTNAFHGDAWEFFRNDILDARDYFAAPGTRKSELRKNQFGASAGGRIVKGKLFYFADYQGTRIRQGALLNGNTVPTAAERASGYTDFSDLLNSTGTFTRPDDLGRNFPNGQIFDPATTRAITAGQVDPVTGILATVNGFVREPFQNNQLPANRLDANAIKILNLFPAPNGSGVQNNYTVTRSNPADTNSFDVRVDEQFNDRNQLFGRYSRIKATSNSPGPFDGFADGGTYNNGDNTFNVHGVAISYMHTFTATLVNEARFGLSREHTDRLPPFANQSGIPAQFGIQGVPQLPLNGGLPQITINNLNPIGGATWLPAESFSNTLQLTENLTKVYKSHSFKGGVEFQHVKFPWLSPPSSKGGFDFDGSYASIPDQGEPLAGAAQLLLTPIPTTVPGGINYAGGSDFVNASSFGRVNSERNYYGAYFQDDWKVNHRLTLNLGLRWEYYGLVGTADANQANFIPGSPSGAGAEYIIPASHQSSPALSPSFVSTLAQDNIKLVYSNAYGSGLGISQKKNLAPRFGLAYEITPKLVVRGGYGIFYGAFENRGGFPSLGFNYPFQYSFNFAPNNYAVTPVVFPDGNIATLEEGLKGVPFDPSQVGGAGLALRGIQFHYQTPYTQSYNLFFQYELSSTDSVEIGYVGSGARHLEAFPDSNLVHELLPPNTDVTQYIPFPDFGQNAPYVATAGESSYSSLQTKITHHFGHGLEFLGGYTWAKTLTDAGDLLATGGLGGFRAPYIAGMRYDTGLSPFDIRHHFVLSGTYELPVGRGKPLLGNLNRVGNGFLGGWSTNWILTLNTGQPQTINCTVPTGSGTGCFALVVPGVDRYTRTLAHYYNAAAFANPVPVATVGQTDLAPLGGSFTQVSGPPFHGVDFSIFKEFHTTESTHLEFRAEAFNLTNTPSFDLPSNTNFQDTANFGLIQSTRSAPRQLQFGLKFYW